MGDYQPFNTTYRSTESQHTTQCQAYTPYGPTQILYHPIPGPAYDQAMQQQKSIYAREPAQAPLYRFLPTTADTDTAPPPYSTESTALDRNLRELTRKEPSKTTIEEVPSVQVERKRWYHYKLKTYLLAFLALVMSAGIGVAIYETLFRVLLSV